MKLTLEEALALAEEARANGHLNKYPQACIVLAEEIYSLKKEQDACTCSKQIVASAPTPGEVSDHTHLIP